jgi:hypothetical protein
LLIAFPNADDPPSGNHESLRKQNPKTQESAAQHPAFLQNRILYRDNFCLSLRPICILHGRLSNIVAATMAVATEMRHKQLAALLLDGAGKIARRAGRKSALGEVSR